jgi:hypothetical protein
MSDTANDGPAEAQDVQQHDLQKVKATALAKIKKVTPELVEAVMALFFACDDATDEVRWLRLPCHEHTHTHTHTHTHLHNLKGRR